MTLRLLLVLISLSALYHLPSHAAVINVPADITSIRISDKLKYFPEDSTRPPLSLEQARAIPANQWVQLTANPNFKGSVNCCYWYTTTLKFENDFEGFIEIDRPIIDDMAVYLLPTDNSCRKYQ